MPPTVLYVGDSVTSDMAAARNAGMDFCWLNPGDSPSRPAHAPAVIVAAIKELRIAAASDRASITKCPRQSNWEKLPNLTTFYLGMDKTQGLDK